VSLARKARSLAKKPPVATPPEVEFMAGRAADMLHDAIDSFMRRDISLARAVRERDAEIDAAKKKARRHCEAAMAARPETIPAHVALIAAARNHERIADFAVDLAECVIYAVEGEIVRHNHMADPEED